MSRERHQLDQTLNSIWRRGDQDEMSSKHIGHGLAALVALGDWRKAADYALPEYYGDRGWTELQVQNAYRNLDQIISVKWSRVARYLEDWGRDKFLDVLQESDFGFHALSYLEADYLPYKQVA